MAGAGLQKKTKEEWTAKHRNVARKLVLEGGRVQNKLFDIGSSDESKCQACHKEEGTEKHGLYCCPEWCEVRRVIPDGFRKREQKARTSKKEWQRGIVTHPLCIKKVGQGPFLYKKSGSVRSTRAGGCLQRVSKVMLQPTALFWVYLESGERVVGQWCIWIMMKS